MCVCVCVYDGEPKNEALFITCWGLRAHNISIPPQLPLSRQKMVGTQHVGIAALPVVLLWGGTAALGLETLLIVTMIGRGWGVLVACEAMCFYWHLVPREPHMLNILQQMDQSCPRKNSPTPKATSISHRMRGSLSKCTCVDCPPHHPALATVVSLWEAWFCSWHPSPFTYTSMLWFYPHSIPNLQDLLFILLPQLIAENTVSCPVFLLLPYPLAAETKEKTAVVGFHSLPLSMNNNCKMIHPIWLPLWRGRGWKEHSLGQALLSKGSSK